MHNIFYTWNEAIQNSYDLAEKVQASGFLPDRVVGIIRGGVISGTIISYFLGKEFQALDANLRDYPHWEHYVPKRGDKKVLYVDDIIDSGETFSRIRERIYDNRFDIEARYATLWYNNECELFKPDYFAIRICKKIHQKVGSFSWTYQNLIKKA